MDGVTVTGQVPLHQNLRLLSQVHTDKPYLWVILGSTDRLRGSSKESLDKDAGWMLSSTHVFIPVRSALKDIAPSQSRHADHGT